MSESTTTINMSGSTNPHPTKVWATLITKSSYMPGLLTLGHSLRRINSAYPLVTLYTEILNDEAHKALDQRGILKQQVDYLLPATPKAYDDDPRFNDCWTKLAVFGLTNYERVVLVDSDMLVTQNMDELMEIPLDDPGKQGTRVFAASHACVCNPLKKAHYPKDWIPQNCAFTSQHPDPVTAQEQGAPSTFGLMKLNGGLLVVRPSQAIYTQIITALANPKTSTYQFPDQDLLGDLFAGRWEALPYVYNALKTMRSPHVHGAIWRDVAVKNIHYILSPKPWDMSQGKQEDGLLQKWWDANHERLIMEREKGIVDEFQESGRKDSQQLERTG